MPNSVWPTTIQAYTEYYKRFNKTYHVLLQLESVAQQGKSIPRVAALVEAMFMAELENQLLTAGHDLAAVESPVQLDVAQGDERYTLLNGQEQLLKPDDMMRCPEPVEGMADEAGIISSVLYGPDRRTRITSKTTRVLFAVYAPACASTADRPAGIGEQAVDQHLQDIQANVHLMAPQAEAEMLEVYGTG